MVKDCDAKDYVEPFTVVGILAEAIVLEVNKMRPDGWVETAILMCEKDPEEYRW